MNGFPGDIPELLEFQCGEINGDPVSCSINCPDILAFGGTIAVVTWAVAPAPPPKPPQSNGLLARVGNCALGYYGIDPLSVTGLAGASKWGLIAAGAGGIPKAIPEALGIVRAIRPPGSSSFTSIFSILSAASRGGGTLRTVANFGSKWAGPIAIASAVIDATAIGISTASD